MPVDFHPIFDPSPTGSDQTLLVLHGTGGNEHSLLPVARSVSPTASLLAVRGQVSENGMPRFFRRFAEGVFDIPDLLARTDELADFLASAAVHYAFNPAKVTAIGYSNGANIASSLLLRHPETLAGAILLRPMTPYEPEPKPDLHGKSVFIASGQVDPIVRVADVNRLAEIFRSCGADVTHPFVDHGHGLVNSEIDEVREWFRKEAQSPPVIYV